MFWSILVSEASDPREGFELLASLPAGALPPCSQLLSLWVQRFSPRRAGGGDKPKEGERLQGSGFSNQCGAAPGGPPAAGPPPRHHVPQSWRTARGGRRAAPAPPSSPPSLLPASLLGNIPPRPGGDGDLSPPPWGRGWRRELLQSPQIPSREHPRPYRDRDALVLGSPPISPPKWRLVVLSDRPGTCCRNSQEVVEHTHCTDGNTEELRLLRISWLDLAAESIGSCLEDLLGKGFAVVCCPSSLQRVRIPVSLYLTAGPLTLQNVLHNSSHFCGGRFTHGVMVQALMSLLRTLSLNL
ncbi:hypothetical protein LEMLEM_LOCUS13355 [Lemmus lemmus]